MVTKTLVTDSSVPVFQFYVDKQLIEGAFSASLELKINDESADNQSYDLIVANKNSYGVSPETNLDFISNSRSHLVKPEIKKVTTYIENKCNEISKDHYGLDIRYKARNCSILFYSKGSKISNHFHFPYAFVSAVYIHVENNCSPIILGDSYEIYPKSGLGLIFPGHLIHRVPETLTDRIMMTMDIEAVTYE